MLLVPVPVALLIMYDSIRGDGGRAGQVLPDAAARAQMLPLHGPVTIVRIHRWTSRSEACGIEVCTQELLVDGRRDAVL